MAQQLPQITRQRASKLQDFVAHASTVNSVFIGRKSGTLMATGGDDKKVNIWSIGKPNCVASITGHQSAVECVALDAHEQTVVAGSAGGTVKMWDLERHQVGRTLSGHRANCLSVQWHPYGEFFASGSVDTNLKIWDVRRKTCIQTYKGHTRGVRQVTLTPTLTLTLTLTLSLSLSLSLNLSLSLGLSLSLTLTLDPLLSRRPMGALGRRRRAGQAVGPDDGTRRRSPP